MLSRSSCPNQDVLELIHSTVGVPEQPTVESAIRCFADGVSELPKWGNSLRYEEPSWYRRKALQAVAVFRGLTADDIERYRLLDDERRRCRRWIQQVGYIERRRFRRRNRCLACVSVLTVKGCVNRLLLDASVPATVPVLVFRAGDASWVEPGWRLRSASNDSMLGSGRYVVKPLFGRWGRGVEPLACTQPVRVDRLLRTLPDCVLIERFISAGGTVPDESNELSGTNTYRVLTFRDADGVRPVDTVARFRSTDSPFGDNWSAGGIARWVDSASGVLGPLTYKARFAGADPEHPQSYEPVQAIEDMQLLAVQAHELVPCLESVGWDVAPGRSGPLVLEGNHDWDVVLHQLVRDVGLRETTNLKLAAR